MAFFYDVLKFAIITHLLTGVFSAMGFAVPYSTSPLCSDVIDPNTGNPIQVTKDSDCIPSFDQTTISTGNPVFDTFGSVTETIQQWMQNPFVRIVTGLPGVLFAVATPPGLPPNQPLLLLGGLFATLFGLSFFMFVLQWWRGFGAKSAE